MRACISSGGQSNRGGTELQRRWVDRKGEPHDEHGLTNREGGGVDEVVGGGVDEDGGGGVVGGVNSGKVSSNSCRKVCRLGGKTMSISVSKAWLSCSVGPPIPRLGC